MNYNKNLELIKSKIPSQLSVKKLIVFGSHAYGETDENSDIDICVIGDLKNRRKLDVIRDIRRSLIDNLNIPLDILVYNEDEFNERAKLSSTLENKIDKDGLIIYEQ